MKALSKLLKSAGTAKRESKGIEFKQSFDVNSPAEWLEILKDVVAIANCGGGLILFGVKDNGSNSEIDVMPILSVDPASITDKIAKYTGEQFSDFEMVEVTREGKQVAVLVIRGTPVPMVFSKHGSYSLPDGKQKNAFGKGVIYFRHGAKSEPGNSNDLRNVIERELCAVRKSWLGNIRKVVEAPAGHNVRILPPEVIESALPTATPIRIVDDPNAPAYRKMNPDETHPYRLKEVLEILNDKIRRERSINNYDLLCVRFSHNVDSNPAYFYKSKFSTPTYSERFVNRIIDEYEKDNNFFEKARTVYCTGRVEGDSV
ncbi:RNA-binding domain-containing protein [Desulfosporosinus sp. BG]|uniref:RNA-binding domain-containing protein n=1 Tax=Desulfosporosinus sp. BG TaxID=1633135 RepID=UPI00083B1970|nr:RNA-binding domain-containing protein [Desulfosporosinus sp. BG]ODA42700.1 hypothetical protein DSBG_0574 [Desulfosporosinus sp. BG]